jgi:predicted ribosomally synthesized peptide with nif11-like leader
MSLENAKRFLDAVSKDQALQQRLAAAGQPAEAIRLAVQAGSERGLPFTAEELGASVGPRPGDGSSELSDDQLESVAGGFGFKIAIAAGGTPSERAFLDYLTREMQREDSLPPSQKP